MIGVSLLKPTLRTTIFKIAGTGVLFSSVPTPTKQNVAWLIIIGELVTRSDNNFFCPFFKWSVFWALHLLANWFRKLLFTSVESLPLSVSTGTSKELHLFLQFPSNGPSSVCRSADIVSLEFYCTCIELKTSYYLHTGGWFGKHHFNLCLFVGKN